MMKIKNFRLKRKQQLHAINKPESLAVEITGLQRAKSTPILSKNDLPCDDDEQEKISDCHDDNKSVESIEKNETESNGGPINFKSSFDNEWDNNGDVTRVRSQSTAESARMQAIDKLQVELRKAQEALQLKDEQVAKLSGIQTEMDRELEELTACLFQEAHGMVREANIKQATSEKALKEAQTKIDVLQAEVSALKSLVITSTPSMHYRKSKLGFLRHGNHTPNPSFSPSHQKASSVGGLTPIQVPAEQKEIDPMLYQEFIAFKRATHADNHESVFIKRVLQEDIEPCLHFANAELCSALLNCIEKNILCIEPIMTSSYPKKCALTGTQKVCKYRFRLGETDKWYNISAACRDRITAVCDFYTYLRYIKQGLVKADEKDMYWEVIRLRSDMSLVKLGL
ncbi:guanine nucleotide exchange factor for Rab-3A-like [Saccoglossus kowalevskii]|uniref:Rab-3A-interacting protein-like n=1 Tax=Saccoglossus kowalevskii TaxID=10224 RepID=A0ABM0GM85_SACKO|nr:PREDICTED: rab-3A-interacting protein-like [Saccoglossus kowalevskii]